MSDSDPPITRSQVAMIVAAVTVALTVALYVWTLQTRVDVLESGLKAELRELKSLLCDSAENREKYGCRSD